MRSSRLAAVLVLCGAASLAGGAELATELVVPAAARGPGAGGSVWRMDLLVTNPGDETMTVQLQWLERGGGNPTPLTRTLTLLGGATAVLGDVVLERFGLLEGAGAVRVVAPAPVAATSRIYNLLGGTTFGQGFDALAAGRAVGAGRTVTVAGLRQDADARSNLFAVAGARGAELRVVARQPFGNAIGSESVLAEPWEAVYLPLTEVVGGSPGNLVADVEVREGSAWVVGSRIDAGSGDPLTLSATSVEVGHLDASALAGTYFGEWVNQSFGSNGSAVLNLSLTPATGAAMLQLDLGGPVLGGSDPPQDVLLGSFGPWGVALEGTSPTFGELRLEIGPDGRVRGGSDDVPGASVEAVTFDGVITDGVASLVYRVDYVGTLEALGTLLAVR